MIISYGRANLGDFYTSSTRLIFAGLAISIYMYAK